MLGYIYNFTSNSVASINQSKFFAGIIMLILNIGSKFITVEFSESQEVYLRNAMGRQLLIFAVCFIATKDLIIALALTAVFTVLADYLFNENSKYCMLPESFKKLKDAIDEDGDGNISEEELSNALKILTAAKSKKQKETQKRIFEKFSSNM
tara:strand:- start:1755 stop:2210 length:456 start_codon:yes stop_codon:yes gene_type:complete